MILQPGIPGYRLHLAFIIFSLRFGIYSAIFGRSQWCQWSSWSYCSPEPCPHTSTDVYNFDGLRLSMLDENVEFCKKRHESSSLAVVQAFVGGVMHSRIPTKRRTRTCYCNANFIDKIINGCNTGAVDESCENCNFDETIYTRHRDQVIDYRIPECNASGLSTLSVIKIVAPIIGGAVILLLIFWFIRALISNRHSRRRGNGSNRPVTRHFAGGDTGSLNGGEEIGFHEGARFQQGIQDVSTRSNASCDLPPAYKDIVFTPVVDFAGTTTAPASSEHFVPVGSSGQYTDPLSSGQLQGQSSSIPPPPRYEEVIHQSIDPALVTSTTH